MLFVYRIFEPQTGTNPALVFKLKHIVMKVFSLFLLVAGWLLVVAAIALLKSGLVPVFAVAGLAVELLGLGLLARANTVSPPAAIFSGRERPY